MLCLVIAMLAVKTRIAPISMITTGSALIIMGYVLTQITVYYTEEQKKTIADQMKEELTKLSCPSRESCQPPLYYLPYVSFGQVLIGIGLILAPIGGVLIIRGRKF